MTKIHTERDEKSWLFAILILFFAGLYLYNIGGWLIHDDEGTDLYEAWQLQLGNVPGVDFIAEQQPLFLLIGKTFLSFSEDTAESVTAVRLVAAVQVLLGSLFLGWVVRQRWGDHIAALTIGITLTSGILYEQARLYRPDPMMFAWELIGFGFVLLALHKGKRPFWGFAGAAFGVAVLMKLFGIFPIIGLALFFLYLFYSEPANWRTHLQNGIWFSVPFLLVSGGVSLFLYSELGFYYQEAFKQHLSLGQNKTIWDQIYISVTTYLSFILVNAIAVFIVPLAILNKRANEDIIQQPEKAFLYTQLIVPLFFVFITRPIFPRYHIFLLPTIGLLLALQLQGLLNKIEERPRAATTLLVFLFITFAFFATFPSITQRLIRTEDDTIALAQFLQANTTPDEIILSDYASLNYHADRLSIYEASIIAGGRIGGGIVTGELLIRRIEEGDVKMILIHGEGGSPSPHHLVNLIDYDIFEAYLNEHFERIERFDRAGQLIEIYQRR